ncbi:aldo-keto reductase family 1 member A1-like [Paramacrobiotus metropolitanus]|uniref:aldo-keto reductase family 1 member A1-like n=1 Tax=Paramacrobiotus metropolitanus TaxID=2943436 RepID=UPI0024464289|nr:aldo-keto reductase family 1 member A1-like [Paramacrobiotus metropolitanus]
MSAQIVPRILLNSGQRMPVLGLGTYQSKSDNVKEAVSYALDVGYRHIDTAYSYGNEQDIGEVVQEKIQKGLVKREDLFIVTKLWSTFHKPEHVIPSLKKSLANLQVDYVDLYLVHNPCGFKYTDESNLFPTDADNNVWYDQTDHMDTWKELEKAVDQGLAKSIGLSNFNKRQIERIVQSARIKPANLQVECHAYFMQKPLFDFCKQHGITLTAYGPLGAPTRLFSVNPNDPVLLEDPVVVEIAKLCGKTPAQVLLRYLIQMGRIVIPKSKTTNRIKANFEIFDFEISPENVAKLGGLDRHLRYYPFDWCKDSVEFPFRDSY